MGRHNFGQHAIASMYSMAAEKAQREHNKRGQNLIRLIEAAEQQAHLDGFYVVAHTLNRAKNACGWEIVNDIEMADKVSRR